MAVAPVDLTIRCSCGSLRGVVRGVSAKRGNRLVCYCDDCQSFAHALGDADRILDAHGGTDIFQTSPARVEIKQGGEHLACLRLRPGGLLRWYAECCKTPIGNTPPWAQMPFVGLIHACVDFSERGGSPDEAFGRVRAGVHGRFAKGDRAQLDAHDKAPVGLIARFLRIVLGARLRGAQRHSPFFDAEKGRPTVHPSVLSPDELRRVETLRDAGDAAA